MSDVQTVDRRFAAEPEEYSGDINWISGKDVVEGWELKGIFEGYLETTTYDKTGTEQKIKMRGDDGELYAMRAYPNLKMQFDSPSKNIEEGDLVWIKCYGERTSKKGRSFKSFGVSVSKSAIEDNFKDDIPI